MEQTVSVGYYRKGGRKTLVVCDFSRDGPAALARFSRHVAKRSV